MEENYFTKEEFQFYVTPILSINLLFSNKRLEKGCGREKWKRKERKQGRFPMTLIYLGFFNVMQNEFVNRKKLLILSDVFIG